MTAPAGFAPLNAIYPCPSKREDLDCRKKQKTGGPSSNRLRSTEQTGHLHSASAKDEAARGY